MYGAPPSKSESEKLSLRGKFTNDLLISNVGILRMTKGATARKEFTSELPSTL